MRRRNFLLSGAVLGTAIAQAKVSFADPPRGDQATDLTGEQALKELIDGNRRFVSGKVEHPHMTKDWIRRLPKGQDPIATILACSDSRVPVELLFDQGFGDLFTIRVAGNVVTRYGIGSMEYAQHHLHTPLFMVLGHEGCGAVTAALLPEEKRKAEPKGVRELLSLVHVGEIDPKADAKSQLNSAVEVNVRNSTRTILELEPSLEGFHRLDGGLLVSAVYNLSTGRIRILEKHVAKSS